VRHVQLADQLQGQLDGIFQVQEMSFMAGIDEEIAFTGDWKPDDDQLLTINGLPEAQVLIAATEMNAIALPVLDVQNFGQENVKGLFTSIGVGHTKRLLVQNFGPQQLLSTQFTLLHDGNVFRRLTEPAFSLGTQLVAIIGAGGDLKFKSYPMLRRILDISPVFREATDAELGAFCAHACLSFGDAQLFAGSADEGVRKLVHAIGKMNVLGVHAVGEIETRANEIGFQLEVVAGRITVPQDRKRAKALFSFLLNRVYRGPLDQQLLITNSVRPL
jgi:hypothetical protein